MVASRTAADDSLTPQQRRNLERLPVPQAALMQGIVAAKPGLSEEGRRERLAALAVALAGQKH